MAKNGGNVPTKDEYKAAIQAASWNEGDGNMFDNFIEAYGWAHKAVSPPELDELVQTVFSDQKAQNISLESTLFWICARAVNDFKANEGHAFLPVSSGLPDMQCFSADYTALQAIFSAKATQDRNVVKRHAQALCAEHSVAYDDKFVDMFVRNLRQVGFRRTSPLENEYHPELLNKLSIEDQVDESWSLQDGQPCDFHWYLAFRAGDRFFSRHGRHPGVDDATLEADKKELTEIGLALVSELQLEDLGVEADPRVFEEYARYGGSEIHNLAAQVGGIASQVLLKSLIRQFSPLNNTCIVNGIHGCVSVMEF
jgi:amyloid beta precursor protein binding protein 1